MTTVPTITYEDLARLLADELHNAGAMKRSSLYHETLHVLRSYGERFEAVDADRLEQVRTGSKTAWVPR